MHKPTLHRLVMVGVLGAAAAGYGAWSLSGEGRANNRAAGFALHSGPIRVGPMPGTPRATDIDRDGDLDLVVVCGPCCGREAHPDSGHALVLLNDGHANFKPAGERIKLGETALGCAIGDINEDGAPDVVAFHHTSYDLAVMIGDGAGGLSEPEMVTMHDGESPHVHSLCLADVNADGHLDALSTLVDDHAMAVMLGDGEGGFAPSLGQPYFAHQHPYAQLNVTDINHDGAPDAVLTDVRGNGMTVLVGSGSGMFSPITGFDLESRMPITSAERPLGCALGDIDGDTDLDAIVFIEEEPLALRMLNDGRGRFVEARDPLVELGVANVGGTLVDVTGDGVLDIVASGTRTQVISLCVGVPGGAFENALLIDAGGKNPKPCVADFNGDGWPDIVTANYDSATLSVLLNQRGVE